MLLLICKKHNTGKFFSKGNPGPPACEGVFRYNTGNFLGAFG